MKDMLIGLAITAYTVLLAASFVGPIVAAYQRQARPQSGATVLKICHGSTIYRLRDGRIVTGGGYRVETPETVCEAP